MLVMMIYQMTKLYYMLGEYKSDPIIPEVDMNLCVVTFCRHLKLGSIITPLIW